MSLHLKVGRNAVATTVDDFLQRRIPAAPRAYLHQLLKKGRVVCNGVVLAAGDFIAANDLVLLPESRRLRELLELSRSLPPEPVVLFEHPQFLIADKPAGLAIHAAQGHETVNLTDLLQKRATVRGEKFRIAPVQRLDLETSGVCLFGKGRQALGELGRLMMEGQLKKQYLALVEGRYAGPQELSSQVAAKGKIKAAHCLVRSLRSNGQASLLEIELQTGRQHQIRQQLAQQGYALCGDSRYHGPELKGLKRVFLHSAQLSFFSPFGGEPVAVSSPLPEELQAALAVVQLQF
jgi:RluA family pseudouridine synthase